jgi:hypothetical protein
MHRITHGMDSPCHCHWLLVHRSPEILTIDFVTNFPESTASGYTGIPVIVDHLTKIAIYLPGRKYIDSP